MTTVVERHSGSAADTLALGQALSAGLRPGDLIVLDGDLGAGKTVFVKGLAAGLGYDVDAVRSPTFVFHHRYPAARLMLHHLDCYRLGPSADLGFLDLEDLLADAAVVIEWGSWADVAPWPSLRVAIAVGAGDERSVRLEAPPAYTDLWAQP